MELLKIVWGNYGFVVRSDIRKKVMMALTKHPKTPSQIATETRIGVTHVSKALSELSGKGLVACVNPNETKGRVYELTKEGLDVAKVIVSDKA